MHTLGGLALMVGFDLEYGPAHVEEAVGWGCAAWRSRVKSAA